nr:hypothetical protein CFP56_36572 [Quercus suber]
MVVAVAVVMVMRVAIVTDGSDKRSQHAVPYILILILFESQCFLIWVSNISPSDHSFFPLKILFFPQLSLLQDKKPIWVLLSFKFIWVFKQIQSDGFHAEDAKKLFFKPD